MRRTAILLAAWLLLLVPTLIIGVVIFRLLDRTQELIATSTVLATTERAQALADTLALTAAEAKAGLTERLAAMDPQSPLDALLAMRGANPLVRNVFVQQPDGTMTWPPADRPATREEASFLHRFDDLLAGRADWSYDDRAPEAPVQPVRRQRQAIYELARSAPATRAIDDQDRTGWLAWYAGNQLSILGWRQAHAEAPRFGLELELVTLLSRLVLELPTDSPDDESIALLDGAGSIVHRTGSIPEVSEAQRIASARIGPHLPQWEVAIYSGGSALLQPGQHTIRLLSGLLAGIFLAAILFGGTLLVWQAWRNLEEARRKTSFVSNVSHELKTPLTAIRMYAELLGEDRVPDAARRKQYLDVIVAESQRLTRLVNNVLDFSRIEQGRKTYTPEWLDLSGVLNEILDAQTPRIEAAGLVLERRLPTGPCRLRTDRDAIEQAVLNLVDNAIKYAADGKWLGCTLRCEASTCRIAFEDRGPGVPPAHQKRIFQKFHRVDDSLTSRRPGSGLGLTIARQLIRDLDGDLAYRLCPEGRGACFEISLPRTEEEPA